MDGSSRGVLNWIRLTTFITALPLLVWMSNKGWNHLVREIWETNVAVFQDERGQFLILALVVVAVMALVGLIRKGPSTTSEIPVVLAVVFVLAFFISAPVFAPMREALERVLNS